MAYVCARELGEGRRALELIRELRDNEGNGVRAIADGSLGCIRAVRGEPGRPVGT